MPEVEKFCVSSLFIKLNPTSARLRSLSGLATGKVLSLPYYRNAEMQAWIKQQITAHDISHLLVFSAAMAQYVMSPELSFKKRVIDFVDIDSDKWQQYALQKRWPMSWLYRREGELLLNFEREVAALFDAGLFVSSTEAGMFKLLAPESADKIGFYNNGVNTDYFAPDEQLPNPYLAKQTVLVFTGAMDYWPNIDAVNWFARHIFPKMRLLQPSLEFYIVGSAPTKKVKQLGKLPGVHVTGRVEDVRPYLQHALVVVAPMRIARGVQNKVLEGMAMEKPVIVTSKGLEGIDASHGEQVLLADTQEQFENCLQQLVEGQHPDIGQQARARISTHFSWDENLPEVVYLLGGKKRVVQAEQGKIANA